MRPRGHKARLGFLTGFLGVRGGFLIGPTLMLALRFTMRCAIPTSPLVMAFAGRPILTAQRIEDLVAFLATGLYIGAMRRRGESRSWIHGKLSAIAYAHELVGMPRP